MNCGGHGIRFVCERERCITLLTSNSIRYPSVGVFFRNDIGILFGLWQTQTSRARTIDFFSILFRTWKLPATCSVQSSLPIRRDITHDGRDVVPLRAFLVYIISAAPKPDRQELMEAIKNSFPSQEPALMSTIAEQYFLEGRQEGIEKGIEKGELIGVIRTCQSSLKVTELVEEELRSISIDALQTMADDLTAKLRTRFGNR